MENILRAIARDLKDRDKLDVSECFIDGTFIAAKKGGLGWERPSGAKFRTSWQWQTALVFQSPYASQVLVRKRRPWKGFSLPTRPNGSSATELTTVTCCMHNWLSKASR